MDTKEVWKQGSIYANEHYDVNEKPNEHDNARDDFAAGALWALKMQNQNKKPEKQLYFVAIHYGNPAKYVTGAVVCTISPKAAMWRVKKSLLAQLHLLKNTASADAGNSRVLKQMKIDRVKKLLKSFKRYWRYHEKKFSDSVVRRNPHIAVYAVGTMPVFTNYWPSFDSENDACLVNVLDPQQIGREQPIG